MIENAQSPQEVMKVIDGKELFWDQYQGTWVQTDELSHKLRGIIEGKGWYRGTADREYDFPLTMEALWSELSQLLCNLGFPEDEDKVSLLLRRLVRTTFSKERLFYVQHVVEGDIQELPFIDLLLELAKQYEAEFRVWTVGDVTWQERKAYKTELGKHIADFLHTQYKDIMWEVGKEKIEYLKKKIQEYLEDISNTPEEKVYVFIIDDKKKNIEQAKAAILSIDVKDEEGNPLVNRVQIGDFIIDNGHEDCRQTACLKELAKQLALHRGEKIFLIVDMDGVLIDNDNAFAEDVRRKLIIEYLNRVSPDQRNKEFPVITVASP